MDDRQPTLFEDLPIQEAPETGKTTSEPGIPEAFKITNETVLEPATPEIAKSTVERILEHITNRLPNPLSVVKPALIENPTDPELLILAALAALLEERPDQSLTYQKRLKRRYVPSHVTASKPRVPANRDRMRDLMRDVMIRNTRSQVDVRLPTGSLR